LPRGAALRWAVVLFVGLAPAAAVTAGLTFWARNSIDAGLQAWDERTLRWLERHGPLSFQNAILLESFGNLAYLVPLTTIAFLFAVFRGRLMLGLSILAAYWPTRLVVGVGWMLWDRQRPTLIAGGIAAPPLHSFPSGHMALATAVYGLLACLWWRATPRWGERLFIGAVLMLLLAVVGAARVRLGSHWPSDIGAGIVVGFAWLIVVVAALLAAESVGGR
jgi:undecaprenyl-diphosphatase